VLAALFSIPFVPDPRAETTQQGVTMNDNHDGPPTALHRGFLAILARIELHARIYFRAVKCPHRKDDAVAETIALSWKWYVRLVERGKEPTRFPSALATYAARAVKSGRRLCGQERAEDVLSPLTQTHQGFGVQQLPGHSTLSGNPVSEALIDNTKSPVPEQAAFRLDFSAWLVSLGERNRKLAEDMALGHRTQDLADRHGLTQGRISQLRREFCLDWHRFHGEAVA
jgi:hypothetical protein